MTNTHTGAELRDKGISEAISNADSKSKDWSHNAYQFLLKYAKTHKEFMTEDVRVASEGIVDEPPSKRAWGGIVVRAVRSGVIQRKGFRSVKNPIAHCTPATLWEVK